ncbi:hypothetical protein ACFOD4_17890 [Pseudoroseomonas globiformis]|uniref:Uncharacterized protein n=1 Tax=Teichococcus globiformis TaxID=2307229 RepID=A0ABV7G9R0_9PROT
MTSTRLPEQASVRDTQDSLIKVYAAARRYMAHRERARILQERRDQAPADLAEAIDRDFIEFDMMRAERRLREALRAAAPLLADDALPDLDDEG